MFTAIRDARNNGIEASNDKTILDYLPYISDIRTAFANSDSYYYFTTPVMPQANEETVYLIRNIAVNGEASLYCGADADGKVAHTSIVGQECNKDYWWTFVPAGEENVYYLQNVGTGNKLYRNGTRGIFVNNANKGDKFTLEASVTAEDATGINALLIYTGSRYLMAENGYLNTNTSVAKANYWVIEKLAFDVNTGIDEIVNDSNDAAVEGIFDLMGRKVENPTKGIYIINGKKVLVK